MHRQSRENLFVTSPLAGGRGHIVSAALQPAQLVREDAIRCDTELYRHQSDGCLGLSRRQSTVSPRRAIFVAGIEATSTGRSAMLTAVCRPRRPKLPVTRDVRRRLQVDCIPTPRRPSRYRSGGVHNQAWAEDVDRWRINYAVIVEHKQNLQLPVGSLVT